MKTYELNLKNYKVADQDIDIKDELYGLMRMPGLYDDGMEICDAVILAKSIGECPVDHLCISEVELALLKKVMNKLIKRPHNPPMSVSMSGPRYEEIIMRVFMLDRE